MKSWGQGGESVYNEAVLVTAWSGRACVSLLLHKERVALPAWGRGQAGFLGAYHAPKYSLTSETVFLHWPRRLCSSHPRRLQFTET